MKSSTKAGLAFGGLILGYALVPTGKYKRKRKRKTRKVDFEKGGETFATLRKGDRIVVTYDQLSPFRYAGAPTETVQLVEKPADGTVAFVVKETMMKGGIDQVYVQAIAEDGTVLGEHKISVQGP